VGPDRRAAKSSSTPKILPFELSSELANLLLFAQTHNGSNFTETSGRAAAQLSIQLDLSRRDNDLQPPRAGRVHYSVSIACAVVAP
jgi:hypothetical protein